MSDVLSILPGMICINSLLRGDAHLLGILKPLGTSCPTCIAGCEALAAGWDSDIHNAANLSTAEICLLRLPGIFMVPRSKDMADVGCSS